MLRSLVLAASLGLAASAASAQIADFNDTVRPTLPGNELLVSEIRTAMPSSDLETMIARTTTTRATAEALQRQLDQAFALAPDDASRSRVAGVLQHTQAALDALKLVPDETSLDAARGRLEQARGEAQESLDELRPFVLALPAAELALPAALPTAGSVAPAEMGVLPLLGLSLMLIGLLLRRGPDRWRPS